MNLSLPSFSFPKAPRFQSLSPSLPQLVAFKTSFRCLRDPSPSPSLRPLPSLSTPVAFTSPPPSPSLSPDPVALNSPSRRFSRPSPSLLPNGAFPHALPSTHSLPQPSLSSLMYTSFPPVLTPLFPPRLTLYPPAQSLPPSISFPYSRSTPLLNPSPPQSLSAAHSLTLSPPAHSLPPCSLSPPLLTLSPSAHSLPSCSLSPPPLTLSPPAHSFPLCSLSPPGLTRLSSLFTLDSPSFNLFSPHYSYFPCSDPSVSPAYWLSPLLTPFSPLLTPFSPLLTLFPLLLTPLPRPHPTLAYLPYPLFPSRSITEPCLNRLQVPSTMSPNRNVMNVFL
ncbi:unnamed protein product [Closterium sp. Yama58-4]|nr:unnamed protein product [Closterium sp. Yama58-4]